MTGVIQTLNRNGRVNPVFMILVCDEKGRAIKRGPLYTRLGSFRTRQAAVEKLEELGMSEYCSC